MRAYPAWCLLSCLAADAGYVMTDSTIRTAVTAWFDDRSGAEATYGHISTWETGGVTDMSYLFCASSYDWLTRTVNGTGHTGPSEFCATSI